MYVLVLAILDLDSFFLSFHFLLFKEKEKKVDNITPPFDLGIVTSPG